jgi:hypothetical protein
MGRKKPVDPNPSPELLRFREKRKWQIALRRYVLETGFSTQYAPYFGLDRKTLRLWFETQFTEDLNWTNFGVNWQFEQVVSASYFDFTRDEELKLCWHFVNLKVDATHSIKNKAIGTDLLVARSYLQGLYEKTQFSPCKKLLDKINEIEDAEKISFNGQVGFLTNLKPYLDAISNYSVFEFELLNRGRTIEDVNREAAQLKNIRL